MRTKNEILNSITDSEDGVNLELVLRAIVEVLLDIRDLLDKPTILVEDTTIDK